MLEKDAQGRPAHGGRHFLAFPAGKNCILVDGTIPIEPGRVRWIRFLTSHPKDLSPDLVSVMAAEPRLCRHVHLPVQSGSDRVLAAMHRGYSAGGFLRLVDAIRGALTGVAITTDILTGFPGETEEDVRLTLALMERVGFDEAFTYRYNPREGTAAALLGDPVAEHEKLERLDRIIAAQRRITARRAAERLRRVTEVLVEGVSKRNPEELLARTEWDAMVVLPGNPSLIGRFVRVRLEVRRLIAAPVLAVVGRSQVVKPTAPPCSGGLGRLPTGG